ncbi:MAG: hydroxymethylglutaryl-CoA lyase [bacterium]
MNKIIIHEVGLRDGLQMEKEIVPTGQKAKWLRNLAASGIDIIQIGSFVHPERVPQMADTDELFRQMTKSMSKPENVIFSGLVLNERGLERGLSCGVEMFCMGVSASETHSRKNTRMTTKEALHRIIAMANLALQEKKEVQVSVQSAFGCGYEGVVPEKSVVEIVEAYVNAGLKNISLADTAGHANPAQVEQLFGTIFKLDSAIECTCHFHNTYGMALANCYAALQTGVTSFESSFGGLGGCPFTAVAGGNVCTEDLVLMLQQMQMRRDTDLDKLIEIAKDASQFFKRDLPGSIYKSGPIPQA